MERPEVSSGIELRCSAALQACGREKKERQNAKYLQEIARKGLWGRDQEEAPSFWNMGDSDDWRIHMCPLWDQTKASFSQKSVSFPIVICEYSLSCPNPGQFLTSVPWALMVASTSVCMMAMPLTTAAVTRATLWMKTRRHVQVKTVPLSLIHALGQEWLSCLQVRSTVLSLVSWSESSSGFQMSSGWNVSTFPPGDLPAIGF